MEVFQARFAKHEDELRWLYMELYNNIDGYNHLVSEMKQYYVSRRTDLKELDQKRSEDPSCYKKNDLIGMMLYIDNFAGNMQGVKKHIDYLEKNNINYIHLMPFLDKPKDKAKSDGGYAVSDYRKVRDDLGSMDDLEELSLVCHKKGINLCMDFVMNHTSEEHEWAQKALAGEKEYQDYYFFFDDFSIPSKFEETVPQVFPTTAPGNFTYLESLDKYVMTCFYPYQWDLNYRNPKVFNEMMFNFLYLANQGLDIIRIDAVPYIWKTLGTPCRNLPQVHTIVRLMRMIGEIVCPSVLLLGEVVMEPEKVVPYFGTVEKPECHMLYNVTTMATTWHTVATKDTRLLRKQLDIVAALPHEYTFLNYLRCHDDIGWGLDYATLKEQGMEEVSHKQFLNNYFRGYYLGSTSRGELYNEDPVTKDARFCGTTASMCGIEAALETKNEKEMDLAIQQHIMLHAYMFMQSGIPVLYSGDEIGQINDNDYKYDPGKVQDSRYIHRGELNWYKAKQIDVKGSLENRIFTRLHALEDIRKTHPAFISEGDAWTLDTWDKAILCMGKYYDKEKIIGVFNFSAQPRTAYLDDIYDGPYTDLLSGEVVDIKQVKLEPYGFRYYSIKFE
ncbi:MAG: alpha-amylase family glycosyl hydrolase [Bacillota bacterium]|nr:alpha-amylase family glycosyl hydrolase [Bacillota bacterium]